LKEPITSHNGAADKAGIGLSLRNGGEKALPLTDKKYPTQNGAQANTK